MAEQRENICSLRHRKEKIDNLFKVTKEEVDNCLKLAKQKRSSESTQNYVDRVRVQDTSHAFGGPGRGSGWRQRSLSNIDLTTQSRHSFTKKTRDCSSGLYDLYSRIESRRDYQGSNNYKDKQKVFDKQIYNSAGPPLDNLGAPDSCSLRRTRSLAVIREETYNDLQITGVRTRRSQLIPRAKLVNRSFFKNRSKSKYREDDSGSGVDTQTSETRESDDYYANLKKLEVIEKVIPPLWLNDKSDLDSLDSDYFKNSSHQPSGNGDAAEKSSGDQKKNIENDQKSEYNVLEIEVHHENSVENIVSNTTTISNSDYSERYSVTKNISDSSVKNISSFDEIVLSSEKDSEDSYSGIPSCELSYNTLTLSRHKISESETALSTYEKHSKFKEDRKSLISYDSIYLSSEGSLDHTIIGDLVEDPLPEITVTSNGELIEVELIKPDEPTEQPTSIEQLYSQVKKTKPKISTTEIKSHLTSFSDTSTRGTLERLTIVSTPAHQKEFQHIEGKLFSTEPFVGSLIDNQYCSLPDANIGVCLRANDNNNTIYDSISRFGRAHKRLRQREDFEIVILNPISIEEQPKEAPSIEVEPPIKEFEENSSLTYSGTPKIETVSESDIKQNFPSAIISLGKKPIIVDELAAKVAKKSLNNSEKSILNNIKPTKSQKTKEVLAEITKEFKRESATKTNIQIIVTDTQNNIIEQCSNEKIPECPPLPPSPKKEVIIPKNKIPKTIIEKTEPLKSPQTVRKSAEELREEFKANLSDTLRKRLATNRASFGPVKPIRVVSAENIGKLDDTYEINSSLTYKVKYKEQSDKMSRPQILTVVDSKRNVCPVAPRQTVVPPPSGTRSKENSNEPVQRISRTSSSSSNSDGKVMKTDPNQEFQEKIDSIRCYWSKLNKENQEKTTDEVDLHKNSNVFVTSIEDEDISAKNCQRNSCSRSELRKNQLNDVNELLSFSPTVEIIELDGHKQAAIVNPQHASDTKEFDHVRYKVMKSDTFQKNILAQNRKEAQFDGLLQYLHNYSFQELLANNNVVIIEPIRTKIEKISGKQAESQTVNCKITGGAGKTSDPKNVVNRHFFYHPIRVNKELLDEELPTPDTVRNARRVFEETLRLRNGKTVATPQFTNSSTTPQHTNTSTTVTNLPATNAQIKASDNLRKKAIRHLTIDTSYGDGPKKWDSMSMSSGVSSGELSSPCECNDHDDNEQKELYSSEEYMCNDGICDTNYVSQDVLEKIRECGSSVTYYGGQVVGIKSPEVSPMTKAIMQEIRGQTNVCGACQPYNCPHRDKVFPKLHEAENSLSLKFKLVKSNSCSSRLELAGTGLDDPQIQTVRNAMENIKHHTSSLHTQIENEIEPEESVRTIVNRLEIGAIGQKNVPRIIESKCIEKTSDPKKTITSNDPWANPVLINNQIMDTNQRTVDLITQVTVNNHINFAVPESLKEQPKKQQTTPTSSSTSTSTGNLNNNTTIVVNDATHLHHHKGNRGDREQKEKLYNGKKCIANSHSDGGNSNIQQQQVGNHVIFSSTRGTSTVVKLPSSNQSSSQTVTVTENMANEAGQQKIKEVEAMPMNNHNNIIGEPIGPRLVKWNTLSKFDEKNYVTNDSRLKQKPKYDDIEFEEFEVYDPNNECYDSLNSK